MGKQKIGKTGRYKLRTRLLFELIMYIVGNHKKGTKIKNNLISNRNKEFDQKLQNLKERRLTKQRATHFAPINVQQSSLCKKVNSTVVVDFIDSLLVGEANPSVNFKSELRIAHNDPRPALTLNKYAVLDEDTETLTPISVSIRPSILSKAIQTNTLAQRNTPA